MARTKQRETYGNGSITPKLGLDGKHKNNRQGKPVWLVCLSLGYTTVVGKDGKPRRRQNKVQRVTYGTITEARKFLKDLAAEYENIEPEAAKAHITFAKACDSWEYSMCNSGRASASALKGYLQSLGHMRKKIGEKELTKVGKQDVEQALVEIKAERKLSGTTMRKIFSVTNRVFAYAIDSDWLVRNPCDHIDAPRNNAVVNRRSLSKDECHEFALALDKAEREAIEYFNEKEKRVTIQNNEYGRTIVWGISDLSCIMALRLELATGMRRSEVLGLTWECVDFERSTVTVRQAIIEEKGAKERGTAMLDVHKTKTHAGTRQISLDATTLGHLRYWKVVQSRIIGCVNPDGKPLEQNEKTPVCIGYKGSWLPPSRISRWWAGVGKKGGFRDKIGFP